MRPEVSLVILTHRRAALLRRCLESLPREAPGCEGLLLVNGEGQGEEELRALAAARWPWLRVLTIPSLPRGAARNRAVRETAGELIYFLDDDTVLPEGFLERLKSAAARHPEAPGLGGPNLAAPCAGAFQRAVDLLLRSPIGAGPMRARYCPVGPERPAAAWSLMLCSLGVRRRAFDAGLRFPDRCASAEENLLLSRVERAFGKPVYCPELVVLHERRGTLAGFCAQVFASGRGRAQITRLDPRSLQPVTLAPLAFWLYALCLPWLPRPAWAGAAAYAAAVAAESLRRAVEDPRAGLLLAPLLPLAHLCYAAGMAAGALEAAVGRPSADVLAGEACAAP